MAALAKIAQNSPSRQNPSELETAVANAFSDLENNASDIKATLRPLQFVSAREVRIAACLFLFCFSRWQGGFRYIMRGCGERVFPVWQAVAEDEKTNTKTHRKAKAQMRT